MKKRFNKLTAWVITLAMLITFILSFTIGVSAATPQFDENSAIASTTYTVTIDNTIQNGTVTASKIEAAEGEEVILTVTPDSGYTLNTLVVMQDGKNVDISSDYTFNMPAGNVTVTATFLEIRKVYMSSYAGYKVKRTEDTVLPIAHGGSYSFTVEIMPGYEKTAEFAVKAGNREDDESLLTVLTPDGDGVYTITNITSDKMIQVVGVYPGKPDSADDFKEGEIYPFKLVCEGDNSHSVTAPYFDSEYVTVGDFDDNNRYCKLTFNIKKYLADKLPGHRAVNSITENTIFTIKWDETVGKWMYIGTTREYAVSCAPETYAVRINPSSNGTVTADKLEAAEGETVTLTVTPNEGYEINTINVWQGETKLEVSGNYTFTMPAGVVSVSATFKKTVYITFDANGGTCETASAATVDGKLTSLPEATRDGYKFKGWFKSQTGGNKITETTFFAESRTIYAQWEEIKFEIVKYNTLKVDFTFPTEGKNIVVVFIDNKNWNDPTFVDLKPVPVTTAKTQGENLMSVYVPDGIELGTGDKIMIWKDFTTLTPLCKAYVVK